MTLTLPEGPFAAFLFDCDGTIVDSMPLHFVAWTRALAEYGCTDFTEALLLLPGRRTPSPASSTPSTSATAHPNPRRRVRRPQGRPVLTSSCHQLQPVPEVLEVIHAHHGKLPFAVVSGSTRDSVVKSLVALGILDLFDTLVCAGDYTHGKPSPEPFLLAARRLGVDPTRCLVFEDADVGIQSATAAGMASVRIAQPWERVAL